MDIEPRGRQLLSEPNVGNLGLRGLDGYPRVIPVWFRFTGDELDHARMQNWARQSRFATLWFRAARRMRDDA